MNLKPQGPGEPVAAWELRASVPPEKAPLAALGWLAYSQASHLRSGLRLLGFLIRVEGFLGGLVKPGKVATQAIGMISAGIPSALP